MQNKTKLTFCSKFQGSRSQSSKETLRKTVHLNPHREENPLSSSSHLIDRRRCVFEARYSVMG